MGKIWVEVGLVSARGLRRSSFLKLQWFAVGWIDPRNKYCTKVDASGGMNPTWNTKFASLVDASEKKFQELELKVEVYSREPIFLTERLQGRATVILKEFLDKQHWVNDDSSHQGVEQIASYQLRKQSSSKPRGFVDISVRITEEGDYSRSYRPGDGGEFELRDRDADITLSSGEISTRVHPKHRLPIMQQRRREISADATKADTPRQQVPVTRKNQENHSQEPTQESHWNPSPGRPYYPPAPEPAPGLIYRQPATTTSPPPPPPPSNIGLVSTFLPRTTNNTALHQPRGGLKDSSPDFTAGLGAGALAAGAVIFGDDFLSGFDVPQRLQ